MEHKPCKKSTRFSTLGLIRSILALSIMLFCVLVAIRDTFRPGLASIVYCFHCLETIVVSVRGWWLYSALHDAIDCISKNIGYSKSIIGIIGLSGTAIQVLSDVSVSKYPGLEKRTVFVWRYPGYIILYFLHICLVLLGEYAVENELKRCAVFCQIGLMTSFAYSIWIMTMSMLPQNTQKFLEPYIVKQVKSSYKKAQKTMPAKDIALYDGLLYRFPMAAYGMEGQDSLNRQFEDFIRQNGVLWNDLLGNYSKQEHARQAKACSLVLQIVARQKMDKDYMMSECFACGLLLWLHSSAPHIFSAEERWQMITQFLADVSMELHRAPEKNVTVTDGMTHGFWDGERVSVEVRISMIALNLIYIENTLWRPMPDVAFARMVKQLEGSVCQNNVSPHFAMEQRYGYLACAMMVYQSICYFTYDHMILPSREMVDSIVEYLYKAVRL